MQQQPILNQQEQSPSNQNVEMAQQIVSKQPTKYKLAIVINLIIALIASGVGYYFGTAQLKSTATTVDVTEAIPSVTQHTTQQPTPVVTTPATSSLASIKTPLPDKTSSPDCDWAEFASDKAGIKFYHYSTCDFGGSKYTYNFYESDSAIYYTYTDDSGKKYDAHKLIEIFTKPASTPISQAISQRFITSMSEADQQLQNCTLDQSSNIPAPGFEIFQLFIDQTKMSEEQYDKYYMGMEPACGGKYNGNWVGYFVSIPQYSKTKYVYLNLGQEAPPFDIATLVLAD